MSNIKMVHLLTQRVFQIASGYEDGNDSNDLRNDPIFKMSCDKLPASDDPLASQPTMCRFENTPSRTTLYRIAGAILDAFIQSYKKVPEGIILDIDDTADSTYGGQQLSIFNAYHDCFCYMPLHIYEGKNRQVDYHHSQAWQKTFRQRNRLNHETYRCKDPRRLA